MIKNTNSNIHNMYSDDHNEANDISGYNNPINNTASLKNTIYGSNQRGNNNTNRPSPKFNNYLDQRKKDIDGKYQNNNNQYPIPNDYQPYLNMRNNYMINDDVLESNANNYMENNYMINHYDPAPNANMRNYDGLRSNAKNMNYMYHDIYRDGQNYVKQVSAQYKGNYKNTNNRTNTNYRPGSQYYRQSSQYQGPINY